MRIHMGYFGVYIELAMLGASEAQATLEVSAWMALPLTPATWLAAPSNACAGLDPEGCFLLYSDKIMPLPGFEPTLWE